MTISYPLTLPTSVSPSSVRFTSIEAIAVSRSPFTFARQVQEHAGNSWGAQVTLPPMTRATAEEWNAFLLKLRGMKGTFFLGDPLAEAPRGVATGTPLVKGANQTGYTLATDGWTHSVTGILLAGDYIQVGQRLYKVLNDADSDSSGNATLDIWPQLRESPSDNATIITTATKGIFCLVTNINEIWAADKTLAYDINFDAVEAV